MLFQPIRETGDYQAIWLAYANLYLSTNKNLVRVANASELQVLTLAVDDPEIWVVVADGTYRLGLPEEVFVVSHQ